MRKLRPLCIALFLLLLAAPATWAQGLVWEIHGGWTRNQDNHPLHLGDGVRANDVVVSTTPGIHASVLVLMPDGQRLLLQCDAAATCAQGYRIPRLQMKPPAAAEALLARIQAELLANPEPQPVAAGARPNSEREMVAKIGDDGNVYVGTLLSGLEPGTYVLSVQSPQTRAPLQTHTLHWTGAGPARVPAALPGVYTIRVVDERRETRRVLTVLAAQQADFERFDQALDKARDVLDDWNEVFPGWPMHGLVRVYLRSLADHPL